MKAFILFFSVLFLSQIGFSQTEGMIKGTIIERGTQDPLPFCKIKATSGDKEFYAHSDFEGKYSLSGLLPGEYTLEIRFVGYEKATLEGVVVKPDTITIVNEELNNAPACRCICSFYIIPELQNPAVPK